MTEILSHKNPFPYLVIKNAYSCEELRLIWQELEFLTYPRKLQDPETFQAACVEKDGEIVYTTNSKAIILDSFYSARDSSNILTINRKLFESGFLKTFSELAPWLRSANSTNWDNTKIRYYGNGTYYDPHTDDWFTGLAISFFHRLPKQYEGGDLYFPEHNIMHECENNSMIIFPGYVTHGVTPVRCEEKAFSGMSRYSMTQFFGCYPTVQQ
jgi:hypothetical protein